MLPGTFISVVSLRFHKHTHRHTISLFVSALLFAPLVLPLVLDYVPPFHALLSSHPLYQPVWLLPTEGGVLSGRQPAAAAAAGTTQVPTDATPLVLESGPLGASASATVAAAAAVAGGVPSATAHRVAFVAGVSTGLTSAPSLAVELTAQHPEPHNGSSLLPLPRPPPVRVPHRGGVLNSPRFSLQLWIKPALLSCYYSLVNRSSQVHPTHQCGPVLLCVVFGSVIAIPVQAMPCVPVMHTLTYAYSCTDTHARTIMHAYERTHMWL
jgi:hypothetical protein